MKRVLPMILIVISLAVAVTGLVCVLKVDKAYKSEVADLETENELLRGDIEYLRASLGDAYSENIRLGNRLDDTVTELQYMADTVDSYAVELEGVNSEIYNLLTAQAELLECSPTYSYQGVYTLTGYTATGNKTASGTVPSAGRTVASNYFAMGTKLYIEGVGVRTVEDTGGMTDNVIDVFMNSESECYAITGSRKVWAIR